MGTERGSERRINYRNRLECGAAFSAARAPLTCSGAWPEQMLDSLVRFGQMWSDAVISHTRWSGMVIIRAVN